MVFNLVFKLDKGGGSPSPQSQAAESVLHLPELLATILLNLPFEDVMRSRAVCKRWQGVIDSDPNLLWHTWRSATPPTDARKRLPKPKQAGDNHNSNSDSDSDSDSVDELSGKKKKVEEESYFEPFRPFFERTLINTDEWITPLHHHHDHHQQPRAQQRTMQRAFIKTSLAEFLARYAHNLKGFYITRPPLKKIESSIRVITATSGKRANCLASTVDRGFTITSENGITVDGYLKALLECLESSWGRINIPSSRVDGAGAGAGGVPRSLEERYLAEEGVSLEELGLSKNLQSKHRLEAQLITMKKEYFDDEDDEDDESSDEEGKEMARRLTSREEWERGVMSSTLIIQVHYSVVPEVAPVPKSRFRQWLGW
ncbi:hypothetical protein H072_3528 [Dactylellina haptotyla CBS 200.50]|uniref:F-box domain-containing protein n=1 Tax=Dactylellina haptotyla (strain CBS 200.50) TaxID=1284197 RepID=S8AHK5_DACHA|nr:hypothetical protein H072_3528 [Dactylellina haptotyla CBS 200.50]